MTLALAATLMCLALIGCATSQQADVAQKGPVNCAFNGPCTGRASQPGAR